MFLSCSKSVLNEQSPSVLTADLLFKTKAGFQNALNGLYSEVRRYRSGETYGSEDDIMNMQAVIGVDNGYGNWRDAIIDIFNYWGTYNLPNKPHTSEVWAWLYETINAANTIIGRSENTGIDWTPEDKATIVAGARLIRAWCYRHLTYLWGPVPLTLEESSGTNIRTDLTRTPVADIQTAMKQDLLYAEQNLPETSSDDAQLLKGTASHFLAELYLATKQYDSAKIEALKVTTDANYKLVTARYGVQKTSPGTPFTDMFLDGNSKRSEGNTEALWVIQSDINLPGGDGSTIMRRYWVNRYYSLSVKGTDGKAATPVLVSAANGGRGIGRLSPTKWAMTIYDANDDRGGDFAWRYYYLINNPASIPKGSKLGDTIYLDKSSTEKITNANWPSTRKWDYASPVDPTVDKSYNDQVFVRAGETYLLLAEADFRLNDLQGAADAINALRNRAHATPIIPSQVTLDFILDERSRELFSEEDRRYVLLRTGTWLTRTKLYNKVGGLTVAARDSLLPIPQDVIDANLTAVLPQNPGY
jgi:hypothetical protein